MLPYTRFVSKVAYAQYTFNNGAAPGYYSGFNTLRPAIVRLDKLPYVIRHLEYVVYVAFDLNGAAGQSSYFAGNTFLFGALTSRSWILDLFPGFSGTPIFFPTQDGTVQYNVTLANARQIAQDYTVPSDMDVEGVSSMLSGAPLFPTQGTSGTLWQAQNSARKAFSLPQTSYLYTGGTSGTQVSPPIRSVPSPVFVEGGFDYLVVFPVVTTQIGTPLNTANPVTVYSSFTCTLDPNTERKQ